MSDKMRMIPFGELLDRMMTEWRSHRTLFEIPQADFYRKADSEIYEVFGESMAVPLGPAAGPHTQIAQNIVASYLTGSRFIELKTVQKLDALEIEKPCIDMTDEGFNTEWSTELTLGQAWEEYAKAWILLHVVERLWNLGVPGMERSFVFNVSVGYDLEGIKTPKMDRYITRIMDSSGEPRFQSWLAELSERLGDLGFLKQGGFEGMKRKVEDLPATIPSEICRSVSLSTMHGCPPEEIESICRYLLTEKGLNTYVKLNPTLLGFERVRRILDDLGFSTVRLKRESFDHDLQWTEAESMLARLEKLAADQGRLFGVKLTNTLSSVNDRDELPGDEMYMSGRALYPLTMNVAALITESFQGRLPISFSGGVSIHNAAKLLSTGIRPLTLATDLLKPGGYRRQVQIAKALEGASGGDLKTLDVEAVKSLAADSLKDGASRKAFRGLDEVNNSGDLPLSDCYVAPCVTACAIQQHIPEYIRLVGEERYADALDLIYERNALPSITGSICDHQCQIRCTRLDYEGCLNIREVKLIAVEKGMKEWRRRRPTPKKRMQPKAAVVGAGPAGLSAAFFLARQGISVTVFEREEDAGGVVRYVVPHFRISREAIESDINVIKDLGVEFRFNQSELTVAGLKARGFTVVVLGIGTYATPPLALEGDNSNIRPAVPFLYDFNRDPGSQKLGRVVATVGAGDTAMDAARSALRVPGVEESWILYRRAFEQMPASREEYEHAAADKVRFAFLRNPERYDADGTLTCRVMELGEKDASGRRRPVGTGETERLKIDTLLYAIGDSPDPETYRDLGLDADEKGRVVTDANLMTEQDGVYVIGDGRLGPSTIVQCIAEGRKAADAVMRSVDPRWKYEERVPSWNAAGRREEIRVKKGEIVPKPAAPYGKTANFGVVEKSRCLECDYVCDKCVDVCPNRANITVPTLGESLFSDIGQIVHIDAYCNECGNCGHFCPWTKGLPYVDKPTVFNSAEDFDDSLNPGWLLTGDSLRWRLGNASGEVPFRGGRVINVPDLEGGERFFRLFEILHRDRASLFGPVELRTPEEIHP